MQTSSSRIQNISFYFLFAVVVLIVAIMFLPFFKVIALGGILAVLFIPLRRKIFKYIKSETFSSFITLILAGIIVLVPVYVIGQLMFNEIVSVYTQQASQTPVMENLKNSISHLSEPFRSIAQNIFNNISQKTTSLAGNAFKTVTDLATNIAGMVLDFILVSFTFYYFLKDGSRLRAFIEGVFPLNRSHEALLVEKLEKAINGVVQGSFIVALLQGGVSTVGFLIFGLPQPLIWGVFTVLASLVPTVGTLISLVPAILYLFFSGSTGAAVGLTIWAFITIQAVGNVVSPKLIGYKTNLHPLLTLLSILGGIILFGYLGFLIGPILVSMLMALFEIYSGKLSEKQTEQ